MRFSEVEQNDKLEWLIRKDGCMHCSDPGCLKACPAEGQLFSMPTVSSTSSPSSASAAVITLRAVRSTFRASTRKTTASTNVRCALTAWWLGRTGLREDLPNGRDSLRYERVDENAGERARGGLKTRGYDNAGLYDPAGVGGTHVMYVLHHADKAKSVSWLAGEPEISETVKFWKGIWKPLAAVGFAATFAASIFHYVGVGPNRADEEENNLHEEKRRGAQMKRRDTIITLHRAGTYQPLDHRLLLHRRR